MEKIYKSNGDLQFFSGENYLDQIPKEILYIILTYLDDLDNIDKIVNIDYQQLFNFKNFQLINSDGSSISLYRLIQTIIKRDYYLAKNVNKGWMILYNDINLLWEKFKKDELFFYYDNIYELNNLTIECLCATDIYRINEYSKYIDYLGLLPICNYTYQIFFVLLETLSLYLNFPDEDEGSLDIIFSGEYEYIGNPSVYVGSESVLIIYFYLLSKTKGLSESQKRSMIHIGRNIHRNESIYNSYYIKLYEYMHKFV